MKLYKNQATQRKDDETRIKKKTTVAADDDGQEGSNKYCYYNTTTTSGKLFLKRCGQRNRCKHLAFTSLVNLNIISYRVYVYLLLYLYR